MCKRWILKYVLFIIVFGLWRVNISFAQEVEFRIYFNKIDPEITKSNLWGHPEAVRYHIAWDVYKIEKHRIEKILPEQVSQESFELLFKKEQLEETTIQLTNQRTWISEELEAQKNYSIRFSKGQIVQNGQTINLDPADPNWITMLTGKKTSFSSEQEGIKDFDRWKAFLWFILPFPIDLPFAGQKFTGQDRLERGDGKFPIWFLIKKSYDTSTPLGKVAFGIIDWCLALGILFILFCHRRLRLSNIFPYKFSLRMDKKRKRFQVPVLSYFIDMIYGALPIKESKDEIEEHVVRGIGFDISYENRKSSEFAEIKLAWRGLTKCTYLFGECKQSTENTEEIEAQAYQVKLSDFQDDLDMSTEELEAKQRKLWARIGSEKCLRIEERLRKLEEYPIIRILLAGIKNLKMNGMFLHTASEEVDRAMENSASSELESLKHKSFIEWLWNLGALAPLAGLLGTVTGISFSFNQIASSPGGTEEIVAQLAPHINEALYTTILGLIVGIFLMLSYYYYNSKLTWIYSKWEQIFVKLTEDI